MSLARARARTFVRRSAATRARTTRTRWMCAALERKNARARRRRPRSTSTGDDVVGGGGEDAREAADALARFGAARGGTWADDAFGTRGTRASADADGDGDARATALMNMARLSGTVEGAAVMGRIPEDVLPFLLRLPSAGGDAEALRRSASGVAEWKNALSRGLLPDADVIWPEDDTFREAMIEALGDLDMARFTRRFPPVLDTLMKNILDILYIYERDRVEEDGEPEMPPSDPQDSQSMSDGEGEGEAQGSGAGDDSDEDGDGEEQSQAGGQGGGGDDVDGDDNVDDFDVGVDAEQAAKEQAKEQAKEKNKEMVQKLMEDFKEQWEPAVDKLDKAAKAFEGLNLDDLADGPEGFDLTRGLWQQTGWKELDSLRKKLQDLRELRDMVRSLGRGSGRGPLRRAPRQRERQGFPMGLVRSPMEPEETAGLCRSDDISRMMPSELTLLASSLPQARLLHFARRAEHTLLSYERVGWSEEPAITIEGFETRPAAECGPIIVCLDTSGSMMGARETVAKAMVLECMRQSRAQQRACFLYSFSGPGDCQELELKLNATGLYGLLEFLSGSFHGGTDVDEPFNRALSRLNEAEWSNADILLVTDGEIAPPDENLVANLNEAKEEMGLKVHGLLVGDAGDPDVMKSLCTHTHKFQSWSAVGGKPS